MQNILSITTSCHVVISVLSLLATSSSQERCGQGASCRGERPKLANGCCPVEQNQACRPDVGDDCDTQLGYNCVNDVGTVVTAGQGTCRGQYNLTAQSVGVNSVNLTWTHVARPLDMYEYVILYRETNYPLGDSGWTPKDVGESPKGLLKDLTPGTLYSIKVGIWTVRSTGNYSEVIMVETQPASFCEHLSTHYAVGQQFVHECEDNCTCLPTGELQCQPVCPGALGIPQAPEEGCEYERGSDCCTYVKRCPVPAESCSYNNETYPHGHEFDLGCQVCECSLGQVTCQYPLGCGAMEATVSCPSPKISGVDEDCCPIRYCESTCTFENRTYQHMEYFTSSECGLCQCSTVDGVQCASECPPVVMVLPSAACPDPHIKKEGCCETLYCHDTSRDILHYIRNVFSLSYSPSMLTLSFEVESQREENGHPTYCQYEILSTNTNDSFGNWSRRLVQPVDVQIQQDQSTHKEPADALTRESAIVVGKRAYVTVSGMQPNTTYFVKIIPLDGLREDMSESHTGQINYSDRNISAMVVARTRPLFNVTSCFHDGREVHHEEVIAAHCGQHCQCLLGKIQCHSTCDAEGYVVARSRTCPIPRLEKTEEQCCPQWTCHPSATGCIYNGLIMTTGQTVYDACQVCKCANGSVQCTPVCQPNGEAPRPGCELTNISGQCCSQWMCPLARLKVYQHASKCISTPQSVSARLKVYQHASKCISTPQSVSARPKVYKHVPKCISMSQSVSTRPKVYQHAPKCINMPQSVSTCSKVYQHVPKCINTPQSVSACPKVYQHAPKCIIMPQSVSTCPKVYHHAPKCINMPQGVSACPKVYKHAPKCIIMTQSVSACLKVYQHTLKCINMP
ncbi:hypothetical protein Btru_012108 [Bulinus truncatus]|nr:hypothetical protein Btru_012108 [Bulinus truncatus]